MLDDEAALHPILMDPVIREIFAVGCSSILDGIDDEDCDGDIERMALHGLRQYISGGVQLYLAGDCSKLVAKFSEVVDPLSIPADADDQEEDDD